MDEHNDSDAERRLSLPDRRTHTYDALENHLDERVDKIENIISRWIKRGLIAFGIIGMTTFLAIGGVFLLLGEVQDTRSDFVRSNCESQNQQHNQSVAALVTAADRDIAAAKQNKDTSQGKVSVAEIQNRKAVTIGLIDALRPNQDCEYLVKLSRGDATPTPIPKLPLSPKPTPTKTP